MGTLLERIMTSIRAGAAAWSQFDNDSPGRTLPDLYSLRWAMYSGSLFDDLNQWSDLMRDRRVYANTSYLYKHVPAVVNFYATTVYQGDLSTDGKQLPDGTRGAIPIDPQVASETDADQLLKAIAELWSAWNWRQGVSVRPTVGAALGDCYTELYDDIDRGFVYPVTIWPGYVTDLTLDAVGNVKAYTLEYQVTEVDDKGKATQSYKFAKQVDKEAFRYFKDDRPFAFAGIGPAVQPNPYGFVPMVADRHTVNPFSERGMAAADSTMQGLMQLNSLLSHGRDLQHKIFNAPVVIRSAQSLAPSNTSIDLSGPIGGQTVDENARAMAETLNFWQGDQYAGLDQPTADLTGVLAMIEFLRDGVLAENPEASFFRELRNMSQVTAPGAERLLGDAAARCRKARAGYDAGSVKLFQMALAMLGWRAHKRIGIGWKGELTKRQQVFLPYDLDSYKAGLMDFGISDRPVILPTESERVELVALKEALQTQWGMEQAGLTPDEAKRVIREKQDAFALVGDFALADQQDGDQIDQQESEVA